MEAVDSGSRGEDECRQLKERLHSFMGSMRHFVSGDSSGAVIIIFTQNYQSHVIKHFISNI